ncbi:MAG: SUMF1/EgtB/PvdO family nonheme iron enzyme [Vicinamibacterales bacterium]
MKDAADRYRRLRARTHELFGMLDDAAYYDRPIHLRHPIVFYDGHLPGFAFNTLVRDALGGRSIDVRLETLFARGIDPAEFVPAGGDGEDGRWPSRDEVRAFTIEADRRVVAALESIDVTGPAAGAVGTILEHEAMHQETLAYMWHRVPLEAKRRPAGYRPAVGEGSPPKQEWIEVPAGCATLGADRQQVAFGWDNEFPALRVSVAPFLMERHDVTNARYLEFVEDGGYGDERLWRPEDWRWIRGDHVERPIFWELHNGAWHWRGMFDLLPLPLSWPVYVSQAEASAFARWSGARLPTEGEYHRAAFGSAEGERPFPWGAEAPAAAHGVFDFEQWDPAPVGSRAAGASAWGIDDLMGNGWEWTATPFAPFPGFTPMATYPQYSADFFDGEHFVMKGASPVTARELLRRSFRNWFRPRYPYVYASFRCVKDVTASSHG